MIGLGTRLRSGRLTIGLRLGGLPPVVVPGLTLANTKTDYVATPAPTVAGFSAAHAALAALLLTRGITLDPIGSRTVAQIVAEVEGKLDQAQPPAEVNVFTPRTPISAVEGDPVSTTTVVSIADSSAAEGNPGATTTIISIADGTALEGNPATTTIVSIADASAAEG